jgi:hypothetical protein
MWESLRLVWIARRTSGAISKVWGKGGKQHHRFPPFPQTGISSAQPLVLDSEAQSIKELHLGLLHAVRGIGIADGFGDPLQCVHAPSVAQVLCRFVRIAPGKAILSMGA